MCRHLVTMNVECFFVPPVPHRHETPLVAACGKGMRLRLAVSSRKMLPRVPTCGLPHTSTEFGHSPCQAIGLSCRGNAAVVGVVVVVGSCVVHPSRPTPELSV